MFLFRTCSFGCCRAAFVRGAGLGLVVHRLALQGGECLGESPKGAICPASLAFFCASKRKRSCCGSARSSCSGSLPLAQQQPLERAGLCAVKSPLPGMDLDARLVFHSKTVTVGKAARLGVSFLGGCFLFLCRKNSASISALRRAVRTLSFLPRNTSKSITKKFGRGPVLIRAATRCS